MKNILVKHCVRKNFYLKIMQDKKIELHKEKNE